MKKQILPLVVLLSLIGLTGCGGSSSSTSGSDSSSEVSSVIDSSEEEVSSDEEISSEVSSSDPVIDVTSVTLDQTSVSIGVGETVTLTATVSPSDATDPSVTWKSSNSAVASVKDGVVTGVAHGSVTITATAGDYSATCEVSVVAPVTEISSISTSDSDEYVRIQGIIYTSGGLSEGDTYNSSTAFIYDGTGAMMVYYRSEYGGTVDSSVEASGFVQGQYIDFYGLLTEYNSLVEVKNDESSVITTYTPENEIDINDITVGEINYGINLDTVKYNMPYDVIAQYDSISGTRYHYLYVEGVKIEVVLNASDTEAVTFFSSLSSGDIIKFRGVSAGYYSSYGYIFNINADYSTYETYTVDASSIILTASKSQIKVGETTKVTVNPLPWYGVFTGYTFSSDRPGIATVDENGVVKGISEGEATIYVTDEKMTTSTDITVVAAPEGTETVETTITFDDSFNTGYTNCDTSGWQKTLTDSNGTSITITHAKGSTNVPVTDGVLSNVSGIRLYKNSTTTIDLPEGYWFDSIATTSESSSYQFTAANVTTTVEGATIGTDLVSFEYEDSSFSFTCSGGQVRLMSMTITYSFATE